MDAIAVKLIHFNCPACQTVVAAPESASGGLISCPHCGGEFSPPAPAPKGSPVWLLILCLAGVTVGLMAAVPLVHRHSQLLVRARQYDSASMAQQRFQKEASELLLRQCTNAIVGLNRIVDMDLATVDSDPNHWRAQVTAEFTNPLGGVERVEMPFVFWTFHSRVDNRDHLLCRVDRDKLTAAEAEARNRRLEYSKRTPSEETAKN